GGRSRRSTACRRRRSRRSRRRRGAVVPLRARAARDADAAMTPTGAGEPFRVSGPVTLATRNRGKLVELQALCAGVLDLRLPPDDPAPPEVEEDQDSYLGNARKKALAIAAFVGGAALADDSGLEVDALPG